MLTTDITRYQSLFQLAVAVNLGFSVIEQLRSPTVFYFERRIEHLIEQLGGVIAVLTDHQNTQVQLQDLQSRLNFARIWAANIKLALRPSTTWERGRGLVFALFAALSFGVLLLSSIFVRTAWPPHLLVIAVAVLYLPFVLAVIADIRRTRHSRGLWKDALGRLSNGSVRYHATAADLDAMKRMMI